MLIVYCKLYLAGHLQYLQGPTASNTLRITTVLYVPWQVCCGNGFPDMKYGKHCYVIALQFY